MLYLFGGAFLVGGSQGANFLNNYLYSGEEIADRGNVIVVTVNYRVGTLGFLSTGDSDLPGENEMLSGCLVLIHWPPCHFVATGLLQILYYNNVTSTLI